ncbi:MAG: YlmH/Sll1252 family protein [Lachnospiraceae bacterium]|nr:YlmH/Sll1252 family protein [Lachnospiraceae bacterium]
MDTEELLKKRFAELAQKCYQKNQYTFAGFLGLADAACFYEMERELSYVPYTLWGGYEGAERVMIRFGSAEMLGYEEAFPIVCLKVSPLAEKFSDELTHRDYLGALMNLGIEREILGDILIEEKTAWIFCTQNMAEFISENMVKVKHTTVLCAESQEIPSFGSRDIQELKLQLSSERIDGMIAKAYKLSRSDSAELFRQKKVFVEGRLCENSSRLLKAGETVSVRGYGKFEYRGETGISRKGKLNVLIGCYGKIKNR